MVDSPDMTRPIVVGQDLCKHYVQGEESIEVLTDINIELHAGQTCAIIGTSGSGKTTLLNLLGTLDTASSGTLSVLGTDVQTLSVAQRTRLRKGNIGFAFQRSYLSQVLTVTENVMLPLQVLGQPRSKGLREAQELLQHLGLEHRLDAQVSQLSAGESQRVAIARSLVFDPKLLLMDEPTGNLDRNTADQIIDLVLQWTQDRNIALAVCTHDDLLADRLELTLRLGGR